ncbi:MAG: DHH family phosphoesterase [Nanoarchaeota archaeon]|nr:DHH family phosphoesterase [Nanoarchaeota archaeon]MBU1320960.1 DHH family phosphoesterase [Nanoarchaeota archaeon]MBU1598345.1 DHH family phosphoesterase [Nanoarchaeota archaeon]MBU2441753.1 DHH family phosphoesterase [Nanoarchaeota archaeon]
MSKGNLNEFEAALKRAADNFKKKDLDQTVKLISNLDADGITAASIMIATLERLNLSYSITILHQLKDENAKELAEEYYENYIFCDLGSGQLNAINNYFKNKKVLILDHHEVQGTPAENISHINPHDFGFDGSTEISAAGVCFFFSRAVNQKNADLAHLAVIGAIGDVQEKNGFNGLNKIIIDTAVEQGKIRIEKGLKLFGLQTRLLHKLLEYSSDLQIPGVTGSESSAVQFLKSLGIAPIENKRWKTYNDLSAQEKKKLAAAIVMKRQTAGIKKPDDIFTNVYILEGEEPGPFKDAKEFSTLLNSCGRMDNACLGIGACLGDKKQRKKAVHSLRAYKRKIMDSMIWYNEHSAKKKSDRIIKGSNYVIINAKENVMATMIGTIASIISKNNVMDDNIFIMSMARNPDDTTKVSLRVTGRPDDVDLKAMVSELVQRVGGEAGGHQQAAGAIIDTSVEDKFIEEAKKLFENKF